MTALLARIDLPRTWADLTDRLANAATRHETWLCAAFAVGVWIEIAICVLRSASLYSVGP